MRTYISDQWLRNWFVGGLATVPYVEERRLSHQSPEAFSQSLSEVWNRIGKRLKIGGKMFIRFGAIPSRYHDPQNILLRSLELSVANWRVCHIRRARSAEFGKRQAGQMGERVKSRSTEEHDFEVALA
jgi:hypothetical protein